MFIQNVELVKFVDDKIIIKDKPHLQKIINFLTFTKPPIVFNENSQDMRNNFFSIAYNDLDPLPQDLRKCIVPITQTKKLRAPQKREIINPEIVKGSFTKVNRQARDFQASFRKDLLDLYHSKCCICRLDNNAFLRASHIIPVEIDPSIAADRTNGLLLCVIHDVAFEKGLIYIDENYKVRFNMQHIKEIRHPLLRMELIRRQNSKITLPNKLQPKKEYLNRHKKIHGV